jgi:hypothetical protein
VKLINGNLPYICGAFPYGKRVDKRLFAFSKQFDSLQLAAGSFNCRPEAVSSHFPYYTIVPLASENSRIKPLGLCFGILLHGDFHSQSDFKPAKDFAEASRPVLLRATEKSPPKLGGDGLLCPAVWGLNNSSGFSRKSVSGGEDGAGQRVVVGQMVGGTACNNLSFRAFLCS